MALDALMKEVWALYGLTVSVVLIRYAVRVRTVGFRGLYWDDFFCFGALFFTTSDAVLVHIVHYTGDSSAVTEKWLETASPADIDRVIYGSKVEYTAWWSYPALIWCMKFTMLFFYKRLTLGSFHAKMIRWLFWFVGMSYFIVACVLIFGCFPVHMNWQVSPVPPWKCAFRPQNCLAVSILNVMTDFAILMVPIPMLWTLKMPLKRKLVIAAVLSSGLFVIAAAIIRAVLTLGGSPSASTINGWGVRETFIGVFAINIPIIRPVFSRAFWMSGSYDPNNTGKSPGYRRSGHVSGDTKSFKGTKLISNVEKAPGTVEYELDERSPVTDAFDVESTASTEKIVPQRINTTRDYSDSYRLDQGIRVDQTYDIRTTQRDAEEGSIRGVWNTIGVPK